MTNETRPHSSESGIDYPHATCPLWLALTAGALIGAIAVGEQLLFEQLNTGQVRELIRHSGHISFFLFLIPMITAPLHQVWPSTTSHWLIHHRNLFGLAFAGNHIWHLTGIIVLYHISEAQPEPIAVLIGGSIGMAYLLLMTLLSFPAIKNQLSVRTNGIVFTLAFYYLVSAFIYDIVIRNLPSPNPLLFGLLISALALRLYSWARSRNSS